MHLIDYYIRQIAFPRAALEEPERQKPIVALVDQIVAAKANDPEADTSAMGQEIDELVYRLYNLTPEEIAVVEGAG